MARDHTEKARDHMEKPFFQHRAGHSRGLGAARPKTVAETHILKRPFRPLLLVWWHGTAREQARDHTGIFSEMRTFSMAPRPPSWFCGWCGGPEPYGKARDHTEKARDHMEKPFFQHRGRPQPRAGGRPAENRR